MQEYPLLTQIKNSSELKAMPAHLLPDLAAEVREFLIENVAKTGGHLASNLGAVELTLAAHRVFETPRDCIMFDVGHQCYVHKMLTGRMEAFDTLRRFGGISGFLRPSESEHDCFVSGHASNSISACLGIARAKKLKGEKGRVVCVIGDGALTGGMAYEALNDAGQSGEPLIVIFNDNEMSIGHNVGAIAKRLEKIRLKPRYFRMKSNAKTFFRRFSWGERAIARISAIKRGIRTTILKESIFEILGFRYIGPANGHDVELVERLLREAADTNEPVVVHLKTIKGKGYFPSERSPEEYHGVSAFDVVSGPGTAGGSETFSAAFGQAICKLAEKDGRICAVTAAMEINTGLCGFAKRFPDRFFDVGIAEEHAVTMAAGLAAGGMTPVCAIYSTFLQRGYDQLLHDVAIAGNHVVFAVDRAGLVGADGATHQGVFDVPYLLTVPGMAVYSPSTFSELESALRNAVLAKGPVAVRYPRGGEGGYEGNSFSSGAVRVTMGDDITVVSYGIMINEALFGAKMLGERNVSAEVIKINRLDSFDWAVIEESYGKTGRLLILEDCVESGCLGQRIASHLGQRGSAGRIELLNLKARFIPEGEVKQLYREYKIDGNAVFEAGMEMTGGKVET